MKKKEGSKVDLKKEQDKKMTLQLAFRAILLIISILVVVFLMFSLIEYVPMPREYVMNMTYKEYANVLYKYEIMMYPSRAEVTYVGPEQERIGVGVVTDPWNLNFGSVPMGGSYSRYVDLTNIGEKDAKVIFRVYGNITPFVGFSKDNFILHPKESISVKITFKSSDEVGNYTGRIDRIVKIPKYDFLYSFW